MYLLIWYLALTALSALVSLSNRRQLSGVLVTVLPSLQHNKGCHNAITASDISTKADIYLGM